MSTAIETPAPRMFCGECGGSYPVQDLARFGNHFVCANCKPGYIQRLREGVQPIGAIRATAHYGGFWMRFLAIFIDGLILSVVTMPVLAAVGLGTGMFSHLDRLDMQDPAALIRIAMFELGFGVFGLAIGLLYQGYFVSKKGGTPGKLALGLRVINAADGSNLSVGKAIGRYFAYILSGIILYIGYIIAAFDVEKRALHDHICSTRVVYK